MTILQAFDIFRTVKRLQNVTIIVNPISGGLKNKSQIVDYVSNYLANEGRKCTVMTTSDRGDAANFAATARKEEIDLVVVVGGDGTINEVATSLVGSEVTLGIIPLGSGNGLARSLGIPIKFKSACKLLSTGQVSRIDVGKVNDRYFVLVAGVGFDARVGKAFDEYGKRGAFSYFYLGLKEYIGYRPTTLRLKTNGRNEVLSPFVVAIANGQQYGNQALIAPAAKLNDGLFDVCIIHKLTVWNSWEALWKLFNGRINQFKASTNFQTDAIVINREDSDIVNIDGEVVLEDRELRISMVRKSLNVIAAPNTPSLV